VTESEIEISYYIIEQLVKAALHTYKQTCTETRLDKLLNNSWSQLSTGNPLQQSTENVAWQWFLMTLDKVIHSLINLK